MGAVVDKDRAGLRIPKFGAVRILSEESLGSLAVPCVNRVGLTVRQGVAGSPLVHCDAADLDGLLADIEFERVGIAGKQFLTSLGPKDVTGRILCPIALDVHIDEILVAVFTFFIRTNYRCICVSYCAFVVVLFQRFTVFIQDQRRADHITIVLRVTANGQVIDIGFPFLVLIQIPGYLDLDQNIFAEE